MVFRAAGQRKTDMSNTQTKHPTLKRLNAKICWMFPTRPTVLSQSVAGRDSVCVSDDHRVLAQIVFVRVGESQSGAKKQTQQQKKL